jgi:cell pole-organizing protein PopZ
MQYRSLREDPDRALALADRIAELKPGPDPATNDAVPPVCNAIDNWLFSEYRDRPSAERTRTQRRQPSLHSSDSAACCIRSRSLARRCSRSLKRRLVVLIDHHSFKSRARPLRAVAAPPRPKGATIRRPARSG